MIKKEDIEKVRKAVNIVQFLNDRGIEVIQHGQSFTALCPLHSERSPSFHVKPEWGRFHCFGCGESGDVFSLVESMDSLSFYGAILELAQYAGIEIKEEENEEFKSLQKLYAVTEAASQYFRKEFMLLPDEHPAKVNFSERDLLEEATKDESVGFSPNNGLIQHLESKGFTRKQMTEVGLLNEKGNQMFRKRVVWSIYNIQGKVTGFTARKIYETDLGPKYVNSPQTPLYNKSGTLFGLNRAHKTIVKEQKVYVVEGQTDVMALRAAGYENVVAPCGTAFGKEHSMLLQRLSDRGKESKHFTVVFCFDGDSAGLKAAKKIFDTDPSLQLISEVVLMPEKTDPCDLRMNEGEEKLQEILESTITLTEFILKQELNQWNIRTIEGQTKFLKEAGTILSTITDSGMLDLYKRKISWWLGIPVTELSNKFNLKRTQNSNTVTQSVVNMADLRKRVLAALVQYPEQTIDALKFYDVTEEMFRNEGKLIFQEALTLFTEKGELEMHDFTNTVLATELLFVDLIAFYDEENKTSQFTKEERLHKVVHNIVKVFSNAHRLEENTQIQSRIAGAMDGDNYIEDEELLFEILEERKKLDVKKRRLKTRQIRNYG